MIKKQFLYQTEKIMSRRIAEPDKKAYLKRMIPIHLAEARLEIENGNIYGAETHIAIAEEMIDETWFLPGLGRFLNN
jgi:hypothetical protein